VRDQAGEAGEEDVWLVLVNWKDVRSKARLVIEKAKPVTSAVERMASLAVHLRNGVTPMGAVGLAAAAVNAIDQTLRENSAPTASPGSSMSAACSVNTVVAAMIAAGWAVNEENKDERRWVRMKRGETMFVVDGDTDMSCGLDDASAMVAAALDAFLPARVRISYSGGRWHDTPAEVHHYQTDHGSEIARLIKAHAADGPRCVLLKGRPGTGKTTLAREIVDRIGAKRAVYLDPSVFGRCRSERLAMLGPSMVVVDDIDKIEDFSCATVENLRRAAPIVILTANNGDNDEVIDGAMGRPGRIDEVFSIDAEPFPREPPFDVLTDEEWADVQVWPVASVNELRRRLELRGRDGMRLDDLRDRVGRRVRSGDVIA
jgi:hypothetical protein